MNREILLSKIVYRIVTKRFLFTFVLIVTVSILQGCVSAPKSNDQYLDPVDPHEDINRKAYDFTDRIDRTVFMPVVNAYIDYVPDAAQRSIGNFYDNLSYPNVVLNDFLQGKVKQGFQDTLRFAINSTIGLFGLFDMATHMGLQEHDEDFGQTLGVWGITPGSYLFVPLLGPSSQRDISSIPFGIFTNVLFYAGVVIGAPITVPLTFLGAVDKRSRLVEPVKIRDEAAIDPYLFVREASMQQREFLVHDGKLPFDLYYEPFQDNPFDDEEKNKKTKRNKL